MQPQTGGLSIIIPVYNNANSISELVRRIHVACASLASPYEAVLIDDGSRDGSWNAICAAAEQNENVVGVRLSRNFGQHPAISAGFERARGDMIVLMDADLEDRPEIIPRLIERLQDDADIVFTHFAADKRASNRPTSRLFHYVTSVLSQTYLPTNVGTMRAFNRKVLDALLQYSESNVVYGPLISTVGFRRAFVHVARDTRLSESSYTFAKRLRIAVQSLIGFSDYPLIFFSIIGMATTVLSLLYALAVVAEYAFTGTRLPSGQTLLLLAITLSAGFIIFAIGIVGIYVFNIYREVLRRPRYLVMDTTNAFKAGKAGERPSA